jgi:glyoxalase family protein
MQGVNGLHHITAISGPAQENLDFYAGVLGMRLVKRSVNQDDPGTYHLFYADAEGHPGTDLTFFPWAHMAPPRMGHGLAVEVSLAIPQDSLAYWGRRFERYGVRLGATETRFGDRVLPILDPHGLRVGLVERPASAWGRFAPWDGSPVDPAHQIRGLDGARIWEASAAPTSTFLTDTLASGVLDVRATPSERRGAWGVGSVHHLAWRVDDVAHQLAVRARVEAAGSHATDVIDRFWFKSVYFKEPGGVLFEIATDGPGFSIDEDRGHLGETLVLPPFLQPHRAEIERMLPPLSMPAQEAGTRSHG